MRKFSILGISLTDYSAREALHKTERYLHSGALNTAAYISSELISRVSGDEERKKTLEQLDLTVCMEPSILEAADIAANGRIREIEERIYLKEVLRRLVRTHSRVCLLTSTAEVMETLSESLQEYQDNLNLAGKKVFEDYEENVERLMNDLNDLAPDVVISGLPWDMTLDLIKEARRYLNAELWLALPEKKMSGMQKISFLHRIQEKWFQKKVSRYNHEKAD